MPINRIPSEHSIFSAPVVGRRAFMTFVGGGFASIPIRAFAQRIPLLGVLMGLADDAETQSRLKAFISGLAGHGWSVGNNLRIEYRFSEGNFQQMDTYAKELVALKPDCILAHSTPVVKALMQASRTVPIVFVSVTDPIGSGFAESIARPGGNVTGFTLLRASITGKYLSLLRTLVPQLTHVAFIYNPESVQNIGAFFLQNFVEVARQLRIEPLVIEVRNQRDIEISLGQLAEKQSKAFMVVPDNFVTFHRFLFVSLAARYRIPAIYPYRYFVEVGGLMSYGVDVVDLFERASDYVNRIIRGASPANLPIQAPTKFELAINLKTAKDLGLVVPRIILAAADHIVE